MSTIKTNAIQTVAGKPILNSTGSILQVVQTIKSDTFTTSTSGSNNWVSITGLSASITPSATSSKVMIFCDIEGAGASVVNTLCAFRVTRSGTAIALGDSRANFFQASVSHTRASYDTNSAFRVPLMILDSPGTTSSITYQVQGQAESSGFHINRTANDQASTNFSATAISSITLMEISA